MKQVTRRIVGVAVLSAAFAAVGTGVASADNGSGYDPQNVRVVHKDPSKPAPQQGQQGPMQGQQAPQQGQQAPQQGQQGPMQGQQTPQQGQQSPQQGPQLPGGLDDKLLQQMGQQQQKSGLLGNFPIKSPGLGI
jgi:hypothetical protein